MDYNSKICANTSIQYKHGEFQRSHCVDTLIRNYRGVLTVVIWGLCLPYYFFCLPKMTASQTTYFSSPDFNLPRHGFVSLKRSRHSVKALVLCTGHSVSTTTSCKLKTLLKVCSNEGTLFWTASLSLQTLHHQ